MNVVDSSGWLEYFKDGENASFFERAILDTSELVVPTICIYEVFKRMSFSLGDEEGLKAVGIMELGQEISLDRSIAIDAAQISLELKLAMVDSIILATARSLNATLWTQDEHFKSLPGVEYIEK